MRGDMLAILGQMIFADHIKSGRFFGRVMREQRNYSFLGCTMFGS